MRRDSFEFEFRSTPPRGRRLPPAFAPCWSRRFRSTPPRGRRRGATAGSTRTSGFDPRLRAGGDGESDEAYRIRKVSIHASAREATFRVPITFEAHDVSIHASAREATRGSPARCWPPACFDPRLRAGGDVPTRRCAAASWCFDPRLRAGGDGRQSRACHPTRAVSIHASAREATEAWPQA